MGGLVVISAGFALAAFALALTRMEYALSRGVGRVHNPMGDVISLVFSWAAFAALMTASLYRFGLVPSLILGGLPLALGRVIPVSSRYQPLFPLKLGLAAVALILAIIALMGVVTLIEGVIFDG